VNLLLKPELAAYLRVYTVESYEKGILYLDGKFDRILEPGFYLFWKNAVLIFVVKADLRQLQLEVSGQEILTRDKAALRVNFYAQYRIVDAVKAVVECKEYDKQLYILMQLALREYIGKYSLDELLENKESISESILKTISVSAGKLGVEISACGIRDIILPGEVKEIMNQVLIAEKKAQANIITRREETASTRSLLNTAKLMEDNAMLFKLKEMEYVEKIADKINTISLSGGNQIIAQLRDIFSPGK
jgi:regulator of protease activity HflC (stomatin/prohibitin superfamily)